MPLCVGVAFKKVAKSYWFSPGNLQLTEGDRVVVESTHGEKLGRVRIGIREVSSDELTSPLQTVLRIATADDIQKEQANFQLATNSWDICSKLISHHNLPIKILQTEYSLNSSTFTIHFASEDRVDFRNLVRDLKCQLKCNVILHQVGVRDHASILGGLGQCGLPLCCSTFLTEFESVSAKLAKDLTIYQNPVRFSGICGKLMCCLNYENDVNTKCSNSPPFIGTFVDTEKGMGKVMEVDVITKAVTVQLTENKEVVVFESASLANGKRNKCNKCNHRSSGTMV